MKLRSEKEIKSPKVRKVQQSEDVQEIENPVPNTVRENAKNRQVATISTQTQSTPVPTNQQLFDELYKDLSQPGAYTEKIKRYLRKNETHSLHKAVRKRFPRRRIVTYYPGQIVQSDLIDMQKLSSKNSGFNFILVVIDCFSKKLWARAMKSKRGEETADSLRSIFLSMQYPVQSIIFDEGLEYLNIHCKNLFEELNIHYYHIRGKHKASSAERVNRTLKNAIWKYFTEQKRQRWVDVLPQLVSNYNMTYHNTIKMRPNDVTWHNRKQVFKTMFPKIRNIVKCRLRVGQRVRVALNKDIFAKGYTVNWSKDIFTIVKAFQKNGVCWYRLADDENKIYPKGKYFHQLNPI